MINAACLSLVGDHDGDSVLVRYPRQCLSDPEELRRPLHGVACFRL